MVITLAMTIPSAPSYASSQEAKKTLVKFQNYLANAQGRYESTYIKIKSNYDSTLAIKESLIRKAKQDFLASNQIRVLALGDNRNYWGNFNCPLTRPNCKYVDKGEKFEVGEVTTIKEVVADQVPYLDGIDVILKLGLIELLNPIEYQAATRVIRDETVAISELQVRYKSDILTNEQSYQKALRVKPAILALKRAIKSPGNFQNTFVTALKFEFNRKSLDELASLPFRYINSLKALDSAIEVTRFSQEADAVAARYSYVKALRINKSCGNTFIKDDEYKVMFDEIKSVYFKITGKRLKSS